MTQANNAYREQRIYGSKISTCKAKIENIVLEWSLVPKSAETSTENDFNQSFLPLSSERSVSYSPGLIGLNWDVCTPNERLWLYLSGLSFSSRSYTPDCLASYVRHIARLGRRPTYIRCMENLAGLDTLVAHLPSQPSLEYAALKLIICMRNLGNRYILGYCNSHRARRQR